MNAETHGVPRVTAEDARPGEQTARLPVGQTELRPEQSELTVDPTGEPVADEGCIAQ